MFYRLRFTRLRWDAYRSTKLKFSLKKGPAQTSYGKQVFVQAIKNCQLLTEPEDSLLGSKQPTLCQMNPMKQRDLPELRGSKLFSNLTCS